MSEDIEDWEAHYELHERRDYVRLVQLCKKDVVRTPDDLQAVERLGEAYLLAGEPQKVLEKIGVYHHRYPDLFCFQSQLLDALDRQVGR